ncbi:MAG: putative lipid II flippase FtsW [Nitrospinota bacterium]
MPKKRVFDPVLLGSVVALVIFGVVMVYSSSAVIGLSRYGDPHYFLKRHIFFAVSGLVLMILMMRVDYRKLRILTFPLMAGVALMLLLVLFSDLGKEVGGARRWLAIGSFSFQPAEFVKLALALFMGHYITKKKEVIRDFGDGFMPFAVITGLFFVLIFVQPDLGTAILLVLMSSAMMLVGGVRPFHMIGSALLMAPFIYLTVFNVAYRKRRIMAFWDPWSDPQDSGFQIIQSLIAFSRGNLLGVGLGEGKQKLMYLPEPHTDFIFSVAAEELGLIGTVAVVLTFALFTWRGLRVSLRATDPYALYLSLSITLVIAIQVLINLFVVLGMLPTKGIPLPFVSLGGTSLIVSLVLTGILLNISEHTS